MFLKSSVLVETAPRGWKYEIDPVTRAFESVGRAKAKFQVFEWYSVTSKTSIPLCRRIVAAKNVRREILDDDGSIVHKNLGQIRAVQVCDLTRKCRHRGHHCGVWAIGAVIACVGCGCAPRSEANNNKTIEWVTRMVRKTFISDSSELK